MTAGSLDRALHDPWIDRQIEQNVAVYHNHGSEGASSRDPVARHAAGPAQTELVGGNGLVEMGTSLAILSA